MDERPTLKAALRRASEMLQNPKEAAILLAHHLGKDRLWLITHEDARVERSDAFFALIKRRMQHEPIEYITGSVSFYGEHFHIAPGALIPRPETELLIDHAAEIIARESLTRIAEIGTGSGIISVMLARRFPELSITATDIDPAVFAIAGRNAEAFGVAGRITFVHTPYLEGIKENFDMIVSNPPYIANHFALEPPLEYEPRHALFGGDAGDEILREIIDLAIEREIPWLACEMGYDQRESLAVYMRSAGIDRYAFYRDYSGFDRGFTAQTRSEASQTVKR